MCPLSWDAEEHKLQNFASCVPKQDLHMQRANNSSKPGFAYPLFPRDDTTEF